MNALNAYNRLNANVAGMKKASEKLSSGYRINRAGDDAAGLAISEKMRSQIRGLNQAVRNSQDGINMIQTFEGAAQETHSILQRMKELAVESANGTYDNSTDRAAIQLEFEQLNDELNQIADTDFNGTIVLNGGEMADGLMATDINNGIGEFDYGNKADQAAAAKAALEAQIAELEASKPGDIFTKKDADGNAVWNAVDDTLYDNTAAKNLWKDLGLGEDVDNVDISFSATVADDGSVSYKAVSGVAYDKEGNVVKELTADDLTKGGITATAAAQTGATGHGGFDVKSASNANAFTNTIFDATSVATGDVLTVNWTGPTAAMKAPTNVGFADVYDAADGTGELNTVGVGTAGKVTVTTNPTVTLHGDVTDANMTEAIANALNTLNGKEIEFTAAANTTTPADFNGAAKIGGQNLANNTVITLQDADGNDVKYYATLAGGVFTIGLCNANGNGIEANGTLLTLNAGQFTNTDAANAGSYKVTLALDKVVAPEAGAQPDATAKESEVDTSEIDAKIADLKAQLTATGVTKADAFDNSTARMTYAENITLQTGARTKDAVNFSFSYNRDGSADMGDLVANLNLSAREGGLETEKLSLANQADANHAIDQIDKAINKTSMVRATFGAIQNRLEHKITNLTTTSENLTEAESSIRDTDMASEMMNYTKFNILQQAAQSMLAQANQQPQSILQLLG